jgi:hypothetical protein
MRNFGLLGLCLVTLPAGIALAQDVTTTNAIRPAGPPCELSPKLAETVTGVFKADKIGGCTARKIGSFEMLGQVTETYEYGDGRHRLQVTVRNGKVVSTTLRGI